MKLMNSETHSCTVSLASLAILAFSGKAFFIILLMLAIGKYLNDIFIKIFERINGNVEKIKLFINITYHALDCLH